MSVSTTVKTNNTFPRDLLSLCIEFAYGVDLESLNHYIQSVLLKARFAPIPIPWSRIFHGRKIQWRSVLDGELNYCIQKFLCYREMMRFVEDINWIALKHSSVRTLVNFAEKNKKNRVLRALQTKKSREIMMWKIYHVLPCIERRDMKKKSWWRVYRINMLNFDTAFPLASYVDPPKVFIL